jgi:hypothetical protein
MYLGKVSKPANRGDRKLFTDFSGTENAGKRADQVFKAGDWMALRMYENMNVSGQSLMGCAVFVCILVCLGRCLTLATGANSAGFLRTSMNAADLLCLSIACFGRVIAAVPPVLVVPI